MLDVLVVDDEPVALAELSYLLRREPSIAAVRTANSADDALRRLDRSMADVVFADVQMPGLNGLELASILERFTSPPAIVFIAASEEHAVDAFALNAVDYLLKPVRAERLTETVRRVLHVVGGGHGEPVDAEEMVPVELGGVTRLVRVSDVRYVEVHGDYARLHTSRDAPLVRVPLTTLEERWRPAGFVRVHRSALVSIAHIEEIRFGAGRATVVVDGTSLQVSRRHTRELRDLLKRRAAGKTP